MEVTVVIHKAFRNAIPVLVHTARCRDRSEDRRGKDLKRHESSCMLHLPPFMEGEGREKNVGHIPDEPDLGHTGQSGSKNGRTCRGVSGRSPDEPFPFATGLEEC